MNVAAGKGNRGDRQKPCTPRLLRHAVQLAQEFLTVILVGGVFSRIASRKNTGAASEGIDLQPLYHRGMVEAVPHRDTLPGQAPFLRGAHARGAKGEIAWRIAQAIPAASAADFNKALKAALERGQNAVLLPAAFAADAAALTAAIRDIHFAGAAELFRLQRAGKAVYFRSVKIR